MPPSEMTMITKAAQTAVRAVRELADVAHRASPQVRANAREFLCSTVHYFAQAPEASAQAGAQEALKVVALFDAVVTPPRSIFAVVALDGSGVWAIGDSAAEARAGAVDHRDYFRDCARSVDDDFPPPETDAAWLDTLTIVTLSGTTESLRALIRSMETGDPVAPWCPADLWDSGEVTP